MNEIVEKQKILSLINEENLTETISFLLKSEGIDPYTACLKIEILQNLSSLFILETSCVYKLFSHFGEIKEIKILDSEALVFFINLTSAYFAQKTLNLKQIPEMNCMLKITWHTPTEPKPIVFTENISETSQKFTRRYDIQIENDREFQVSKLIIGPKGINMKSIIEKCCRGMSEPIHDIIKLRLRGKGSGFKEGPEKIESEEPLHICVSSKFSEKLKIASKEIEKLILHVYDEYKKFRTSRGLPEINLLIKKTDTFPLKTNFSNENLYVSHNTEKVTRDVSGYEIRFKNPEKNERNNRRALFEKNN